MVDFGKIFSIIFCFQNVFKELFCKEKVNSFLSSVCQFLKVSTYIFYFFFFIPLLTFACFLLLILDNILHPMLTTSLCKSHIYIYIYIFISSSRDTLCTRTTQIKEGLNCFFCLVPYNIITFEVRKYC